MTGTRLIDKFKHVLGFPPAVPSTASPAYVRLDNFNHLTIRISGSNASAGVTPVAVSLQQATSLTGTGAAAFAFTTMFANPDTSLGDSFTQTAVVGNTFTLTGTVSKNFEYVIEVDASTLNVAGGYDCLQVVLANGAAQTVSVTYTLSGCRFGGGFASMPSAVV